MQLPSDLTKIIKEFLLLPRHDFIVKRDFLKQLYFAEISVLLNMIRTFNVTTIRYKNTRVSIDRFRSCNIPILETQQVLASNVLELVSNDTTLFLSLGTHFHHCFYGNIYNWTNRPSIGDICGVFNMTIVFNKKTYYSMKRKGIIVKKDQFVIEVALYDYIVMPHVEDPHLLRLTWLPETSQTITIGSPNRFDLEKLLKDLYRNDENEVLWDDSGFDFEA
jgi:hypothetical protein